MNFHKTIAAMIVATLLAAGSQATGQSIIRTDGDRCNNGLQTAVAQFGAKISLDSPPRRIAGKCVASSVLLTNPPAAWAITIEQVRWASGSLAPLADGNIPPQLNMDLSGISVQFPRKNDPVLEIIRQYFGNGNSFDAQVRWTFSGEDKQLELRQLSLDFGNENRLMITAKLTNVSPILLSRPEVLGLASLANELTVSISGDRRFGKEIVAAITASIPENDQPATDNASLKSLLRDAALSALGDVLDSPSQASLNRLIDSIPDPSGSLSLQLLSEPGITLLRLAALIRAGALSKLPDSAGLSLDYQPGAGG